MRKLLRQWRDEVGYSRTALAELAGVHFDTIKRIETGKIRSLRDRTREALAKALEINPPQIVLFHHEVRGANIPNQTQCVKYNLITWRMKRGLSLTQLAKQTGLSFYTVQNVEKCRHKPILRTLKNLASVLGIEWKQIDVRREAIPVIEAPHISDEDNSLMAWRMRKGLSRKKLAIRADLSLKTIYNIEGGSIKRVSPETRRKLITGLSLLPAEAQVIAF